MSKDTKSPKIKKPYYKSKKCLICGSFKLTKYLSLGRAAPANSYLTKAQLKKDEFKAPLEVYFCHNCHLAQLLHIVDRRLLYNRYDYFSSTSPMLVKHFEEYANEIFRRFPKQSKQLVIDIGSNDGVLLKPLKILGARVLGIDPARNIARVANKEGIETIAAFFNKDLAAKIIKKYGRAGIITSNNTLAHTDIIHDIFAGVRNLLDSNGVFIFEVQYLADLLTHNEFDNIYHEHICYYSVGPLSYLLKMHGMEIFDILHTDTHGGGIMVFASHSSAFPIRKNVNTFIKNEKLLGLHKLATYKKFAKRPPEVKKKFRKMLLDLKRKGKKIVAYGASAKATTLLQYCNIGSDVINYIVDDAPSKQGKFTPGTHIPIVSSDVLKLKKPDYIVVTAWNYAKNIMEVKENWFKETGGRFIIPIPNPVIV